MEEADWHALADLFNSVGWARRDVDKLKRAYGRSYLKCFAFHDGRLVGAARAISDGEFYAGIYDVIVAPECQGEGVGRRMMSYLLENLSSLQVLLVSVPGKEGFYHGLRFRRNKTAMTLYPQPEQAAAAGLIE